MTKLSQSNPVVRETAAIYRRRALCFRAEATKFLVWEKKCPTTLVSIDYEVIYEAAMRLIYLEKQKEKQAKKNGRKHVRRKR